MDVTISVPGTFHAFDLAEGLNQRGKFEHIYTSHPVISLNTNLPPSKISSIIHPEIIFQFGNRLELREFVSLFSSWNSPFVRWKFRVFDRAVARSLSPASSDESLFLGFAGACLQSIRKAKELGYTTAVERSSVHIRKQQEILSKEFGTTGDTQPISDQHVEVEEQEYEETDYIVSPSDYVTESFAVQGLDDKVITIPLGVDPNRTVGVTETIPPSVSPDDTIFLYVGALSLQKGVRTLLDAWESADLENSHLVLAGGIDPEIKPLLEQANESVHAIGWQDNIDDWFAGADYFIFPSLQDGFALAVLEALFHGLPTIVTESTGAKMCVRDERDGLIIPSGNREALLEAIEELAHKEWNRNDIASYAQSNYSMDAYYSRILEEYKNMVCSSE